MFAALPAVGCQRSEHRSGDATPAERPQPVATAPVPADVPEVPDVPAQAASASSESASSEPAAAAAPDAAASSPSAHIDRQPQPLPSAKPAPADGPQLRAEAAEFFEELVHRVPNNPDALEVKARFHLLIGESMAAKECWEQALRLAPDYAYAQHGLGKVAMLNAETEQAVKHFKKAIAGQSENVDLVHDLADAYTKLGKLDDAVALLQQASVAHPQSTTTWVLLGQACLANRDFARAREAFEHALSLMPNLPRAQQGLGTALMRLGERDKAKSLLEAQRANRVAGKNRSAEETFADELAEVAKRYVFAARVYLAQNDKVRAEYALRRATVFQPREESAWALLLAFYQSEKRLSDAIQAAQEMCRIAPENPSYHYTLGVLAGQAKDVPQAESAFQEVIRLAPKSVEGYQGLVKLLIGTGGDRDRCVELAQKGVELRGAASDFELLAQAYAVNQQYDDAHQALARAIELDPDNRAYLVAMRQLNRVMGSENE